MKAKLIVQITIAYIVGILTWCYAAPFIIQWLCHAITRNQ